MGSLLSGLVAETIIQHVETVAVSHIQSKVWINMMKQHLHHNKTETTTSSSKECNSQEKKKAIH